MEDAKFTELAAKYLSGNIQPDERRELMEWIAAGDDQQAFFDDIVQLWESATPVDQPIQVDLTAAWSKVEHALNDKSVADNQPKERTASLRSLPLITRLLRIAAILVPLLLIGYWWWEASRSDQITESVVIATLEEIKEVVLPDGSVVWLNENSHLEYTLPFEQRTVNLEGEAFFDVQPDSLRPFQVYTGPTVTRVLGTSFNLRAYAHEAQVLVTVTSGRVELQEQGDVADKIELTAGEAAVFLKADQQVVPANSLGNNAVAWKNQVIDANGISLEQMVQTLNNYFNVDIQVADSDALSCNVTLHDLRNPSLEGALQLLTEFMFLQVDSTANQIVLTGPGC